MCQKLDKLKWNGQFPKTLPDIWIIENLNRHKIRKKIKSVIKISLQRKPSTRWLHCLILPNSWRFDSHSSQNSSKKTEEEGMFLISHYEASTTLIPNLDEDIKKRKLYCSIFLTNLDIKLLSKILGNQIQ